MTDNPQSRRSPQRQALPAQALEIWQFIATYFDQHGYAPRIQDIGEACSLSPRTVSRQLERLESREYITRIPRKLRSIRLLKYPGFSGP